ncbi:MAG: alkaline phosphatase family protein [Anaerolineaceae bacterium]|nr:alkaline phosphatase family protein [Anaerolineaceae bacterium]
MAACGIHPYAFQHHAIAHSGLSSMLFTGVEVNPFRSLSDLWVSLGGLLDEKRNEQKYIYLYWSDLDDHSHRFGPQDERVSLELEVFSVQLAHFIRQQKLRARNDTLLLITADHGHISTPRNLNYELRSHPELQRCLAMSPSGEARLPLVFLRSGYEAQFLEYVEKAWPGQFRAIPSTQAIACGLFGPGSMYERLPERAGDYIIVPQDSAYWWFGSRDNPLLGRHGGLTRTEMLVPFFSMLL